VDQPVVTRTTNAGFENIRINTGLLELTIIPELGGKISGLRDLRTGREWFWRHPRMEYKHLSHGSSFVEAADTGGWDECFPSVSPCEYPSAPWSGASIQDHGELWSQVPEIGLETWAGNLAFTTRWHGLALPYTFTRTILLVPDSPCLRVDYAVRNDSARPVNFVWCIHPLLAIEPGMQLHLPIPARFNSNGTIPPDAFSADSNLIYPFDMPGLKFPAIPELSAARSIKIWSDPLPAGEGWAALSAGNGELRMQWDVALLPQLAVWMNFGAWAGDGGAPYFNLGIEPCIGAQDSLADAVTRQKLYASLPPHALKTWWLEIELRA
jgi:hypothetical protein